MLGFGSWLETVQSIIDIDKEPGLGHLAIGDDVDAAFDLLLDTLEDRAREHFVISRRIEILTGNLRLHQIKQI